MYKKTILDNGLKLITLVMPKRQSVSLGVWIGVGGRHENFQNKGIAHFLEHMAFKGSKKYSCREIKEKIEGVGGLLNGFTSEEFTCYLTKTPAKYLNLSLDILLDMTFNPLLQESEAEKERTVILEEIKMYKDLPQHYVQELLDLLLWPDHPLGASLAGSAETVGGIKRNDIARFQRQYYCPGNVVVAACGNLVHQDILEKIKKLSVRDSSTEKSIFKKADNQQSEPRMNLSFKETEQSHLAMGFLGVKRDHPDRHVLGLLNVILGANMSSRLFEEIREKRGMAYSIHSHHKCLTDTGCFLIDAGVDNNKAYETIKLILQELQRIKDEDVKNDEFTRAKEYYAGQLMLGLEDTLEHMLWIGESVVSLDKTFTLDQILKDVNKIEISDLRRVANSIFKGEKVNLALIGPSAKSSGSEIKKLIQDSKILN
ncbi:MAG: pitrilysin family protein [Candidatus Omnitrophota bacterium]|nr:pitrilysin family protein [Candidatus Omnitrophota bacterium]